ncbi:hypothetical protein [Bradyrhizobium jicamae]|uniref:hypothetical protein n=1 Tax=Bradyrhizobium jicamae TaxID=280332 RepID=UPI001BA4947E|nr:hypothetical protein [Bradyrhizobium jicamae]MBR0934154.1 hypothetical protein [Bradyrhizobium jicamae]
MAGDAPITWLMFFTLGAGVVVAAGLFIAFLRSRHNREIVAGALGGDGRSKGVEPSGAGVELGGLSVIALFAMIMLAVGYRTQSGTRAAEAVTRPNNELAAERNKPDAPKPYQPANPAPDPRTSPTSSTTGQGPNSGGRPEGQPKQ